MGTAVHTHLSLGSIQVHLLSYSCRLGEKDDDNDGDDDDDDNVVLMLLV